MESFICRLMFFALIAHQVSSADQQTVFRSQRQANALLLRSRRANLFLLEEILQGNLERECFEEKCNKEEARECFEDDQKTVRHLKILKHTLLISERIIRAGLDPESFLLGCL